MGLVPMPSEPRNRRNISYGPISRKIAKRTQIPASTVERVLEAFAGLVIEEVMLHGKFHFPNIFTIEKRVRKTVVDGKVYENYPMLGIKSSEVIRRLYLAQTLRWSEHPGIVNGATWRDAFTYIKKNGWSGTPDFIVDQSDNDNGFNPFLDESDE